jgi:hypothetical protein
VSVDWMLPPRSSRARLVCAVLSLGGQVRYLLGIPTIILSAGVGTAVFASLNKQAMGNSIKLVFGLISIMAAVLASLQTLG